MLYLYIVNLQDDFLKIHKCSVIGNDQTPHFPPHCLVTAPNYFLGEETEVNLTVSLKSMANHNAHVCWWLARTAETASGDSLHPFPDPSLRDTA